MRLNGFTCSQLASPMSLARANPVTCKDGKNAVLPDCITSKAVLNLFQERTGVSPQRLCSEALQRWRQAQAAAGRLLGGACP